MKPFAVYVIRPRGTAQLVSRHKTRQLAERQRDDFARRAARMGSGSTYEVREQSEKPKPIPPVMEQPL